MEWFTDIKWYEMDWFRNAVIAFIVFVLIATGISGFISRRNRRRNGAGYSRDD